LAVLNVLLSTPSCASTQVRGQCTLTSVVDGSSNKLLTMTATPVLVSSPLYILGNVHTYVILTFRSKSSRSWAPLLSRART
jgi:hypothetical protein